MGPQLIGNFRIFKWRRQDKSRPNTWKSRARLSTRRRNGALVASLPNSCTGLSNRRIQPNSDRLPVSEQSGFVTI